MMRDNRIRYFAPADYSDGSDLDMLVKTIIDRTVKNEAIESTYFACRKEQIEEDKKSTEEGERKERSNSSIGGKQELCNNSRYY